MTPIQISAEASGSGTATLSLTGVTAGSTIVVIVWQTTASARTYSATSYTVPTGGHTTGAGRQACIMYRTGVASGSHSITVNANTGTVAITAIAVEIPASTFSAADFVIEGGNNTSHDCANTGNLDVSGDAIILSVGVLNASGTTLTVTSGGVQMNSVVNNVMVQYKLSGSGFTDEKSTWTSSTTRTGVNVSVGFTATGGGGPVIAVFRHHYQQQGVA